MFTFSVTRSYFEVWMSKFPCENYTDTIYQEFLNIENDRDSPYFLLTNAIVHFLALLKLLLVVYGSRYLVPANKMATLLGCLLMFHFLIVRHTLGFAMLVWNLSFLYTTLYFRLMKRMALVGILVLMCYSQPRTLFVIDVMCVYILKWQASHTWRRDVLKLRCLMFFVACLTFVLLYFKARQYSLVAQVANVLPMLVILFRYQWATDVGYRVVPLYSAIICWFICCLIREDFDNLANFLKKMIAQGVFTT